MEQALLELIELAKSAAPELWEIAKMQVQANVWGLQAALWLMGIVIVILIVWVAYVLKKDGIRAGMWELQFIFALVFAGLWVAAYISRGMMLISPDYYAIKKLLILVR
jgi:hypothetical protein